MHVTLRARRGLPSFRHEVPARIMQTVFRELSSGAGAATFRVVHFSIQADHVHLIVEGADRSALTRGMSRLLIRIAKRLGGLLAAVRGHRRARTGRVWSGRYHRHDLRSPREVRNALVYVLGNAKKHGQLDAVRNDPFASASDLTGADLAGPVASGQVDAELARLAAGQRPHEERCTAPPRTWLLAIGWRRHGLVRPGEGPRERRRTRARQRAGGGRLLHS